MGILVKVLRGVWKKADSGEWDFLVSPDEVVRQVVLQENESFDNLCEIVKATYQIDGHTKVALTFQFPEEMFVLHRNLTSPVDISDNKAVEEFMAVRLKNEAMGICVTCGEREVERYHFQKRDNFSVGGGSNFRITDHDKRKLDDQPINYRGLDDGDCFIMASLNVMEEIFTTKEMLVIERTNIPTTQKIPNSTVGSTGNGGCSSGLTPNEGLRTVVHSEVLDPRKMKNLEDINQREATTTGPQTIIETKEDARMNTTDIPEDTRMHSIEIPEDRTIGSSFIQVSDSSRSTPLHSYQSTRSVKLYQAALRGDWNAAKIIIDEQNDHIVRKEINSGSETALHIAVAAKHTGFVRNLLGRMKSVDLVLKNIDKNTALHIAAAMGVVDIAKMLVKKNGDLPNIVGGEEITPIHVAALFSHEEMVRYLERVTNLTNIRGMKLKNLFHDIIAADIYDVALSMLKGKEKEFALPQNGNTETALHLMARKPSTIISRNKQLNFYKKLAHNLSNGFFFRKAKRGTLAHQLVEKLWKSVVHLEKVSVIIGPPSKLLFDAAESGNVEFLVILIRSYPDIIWKADEKSHSLFHIAAFNRHESIFKLINELRGIKNLVASYVEKESEDNLLHIVARLPPPRRLQVVSGAALQMQREIIWFEAVEKIVPLSYIKAENKKRITAHALFTAEHDNLRKEGEKWMKETATACMLVATLIATVVFGAAFAMPGSYDDSTEYDEKTKHNTIAGYPRFRKKFWFDVFMLSDSVSLFSSVTAVVFFLSLLTSRYAEKDFRRALPVKLMLGLLALFFSIVSMVLAFIATMILIRDHEPHWSFILIVFLASVTALSFTYLNFHLWFDTLYSAYASKFLFYGCKRGLFQKEENCLTSLFF